MDPSHHEPRPSFWRSPAGLAWLVAAVVAAIYLLTEHLSHLYGVFSLLLLLACPLMHVFMHRGHHHRHHGGHTPAPGDSDAQPPADREGR